MSACPASTIAALASYWIARTASLLEFEQAHRGSCLRVRIEDLHANATQALLDISDFLGLDGEHVVAGTGQDTGKSEPADGNLLTTPTGIPLAQIPPPLLAQLDELHRRLGYPPVTTAGR